MTEIPALPAGPNRSIFTSRALGLASVVASAAIGYGIVYELTQEVSKDPHVIASDQNALARTHTCLAYVTKNGRELDATKPDTATATTLSNCGFELFEKPLDGSAHIEKVTLPSPNALKIQAHELETKLQDESYKRMSQDSGAFFAVACGGMAVFLQVSLDRGLARKL